MPATIIDSKIFGDMFSDAKMRQVWSDENRTAKYLDIERALAKVQGELGLIPQEAADEIVKNCNLDQIDWGSRPGPSRSAIRSSPSSTRSMPIAAISSANTATGARRRRTSPTPRPYCRSARAWRWSKPT